MAKGDSYKIIQALQEWEGKEGSLPDYLLIYRNLLRIQDSVKPVIDISDLGLTGEVIKNKLMQGRPIIEFNNLCIDWCQLTQVLRQVTSLIDQAPGKLAEIVSKCLPPELLRETVDSWFEGKPLSGLPLNDTEKDTFQAILTDAMKPFLSSYSEALLPLANQEQWRRGYCPVCGGCSDFSFLDRERGSRWLVCSRCDAQWLFQRLECHCCGNRNQNELNYYSDDSGLYRLYVCEVCKCYMKTIDLRQTQKEVFLPLERYLTLDMDRQAREKGYVAGGGAKNAVPA